MITTYTELQAAIATWLERDDLTASIPDFIQLAEARHKRDVRMVEMITRSAITVSDRYPAFPTGFLEPITFKLLTNPVTALQQVSPDQLDGIRIESTGRPTAYTIYETFELDRAPDQSYNGELRCYTAVTALSVSNADNAILLRHPDLYLYGALSATAPFLMHDERLTIWEALYQSAVKGSATQFRRARRSGNRQPRIAGSIV